MYSECKSELKAILLVLPPLQAISHPSLPCCVHWKAHTYRSFHLGPFVLQLPADVRSIRQSGDLREEGRHKSWFSSFHHAFGCIFWWQLNLCNYWHQKNDGTGLKAECRKDGEQKEEEDLLVSYMAKEVFWGLK